MKTSLLTSNNKRHINIPVILLIAIVSLFSTKITGAESAGTKAALGKSDSIIVTKTRVSKKYKIKIYPNVTNEVLFFSAVGEEGKVYELFVFGMDGKLIKRIQVRNRETTLLRTFQKGSYFYEVFSNDERIENGSMVIQ